MQLNAKRFALATGSLWALVLFVATLVATARGIGKNLSHLSAIYIGYDATYLGSILGLVYGFASGFILGWLFATIYNGSTEPKAVNG